MKELCRKCDGYGCSKCDSDGYVEKTERTKLDRATHVALIGIVVCIILVGLLILMPYEESERDYRIYEGKVINVKYSGYQGTSGADTAIYLDNSSVFIVDGHQIGLKLNHYYRFYVYQGFGGNHLGKREYLGNETEYMKSKGGI